jgi:hypothetical protein
MNQMPPLASHLLAGTFLVLGAVMLVWRNGPNCWIGVRLPWTFADRKIWDRSWLLTAVLVVAMGVSLLISPAFFMPALLGLLIASILYPLLLYHRKYGTWRTWKDTGLMDYRPAARCPQCGNIQKLKDSGELAEGHCEVCGSPLTR